MFSKNRLTTMKAIAVLLFVTFMLLVSTQGSLGQGLIPQQNGWSDNVSLTGLSDPQGFGPRVVVDRAGTLHVFWHSIIEDDDALSEDALHAMMYNRREGDTWRSPVDILATPDLGPFLIGSVAVDDRDYLNVLWYDQGETRRLFLSQAHATMAEDSRAWTTRVLDSPDIATSHPHLIILPGGGMHVIYAIDNSTILYNSSVDYGQTWGIPVTIWSVRDPSSEGVSAPRIAVDGKGYLHAVWTYNAGSRNWAPMVVYYARSTDNGFSWEIEPVYPYGNDETTTGWINVAVRNGDEIHLAWNRAVNSHDGRYHMWSPDNGQSWTEPQMFMPPFVSGQTQWPLMEVDSGGTLHLVTVAAARDNITAPRYTSWDGISWSPMVSFPESSGDFDTWYTIGLGNQLHLVHPVRRFTGTFVYNNRITDAPSVAPQVIILPEEVRLTSEPTVVHKDSMVQPSKTVDFETTASQDPFVRTSSLAIVLPLIIVSFFVLAIVLFHRRGKGRSR